jgi:hypothetical protein
MPKIFQAQEEKAAQFVQNPAEKKYLKNLKYTIIDAHESHWNTNDGINLE